VDSSLDVDRRSFLIGGAGAAAAVAVASPGGTALAQDAAPKVKAALPKYADWKDASALIVHSDKTLEMKREEFGNSLITPESKLYIRNNINPPDASVIANRDSWKVEFGGVKYPKSLTVAELKTLGVVTIATVLQCSGNGRKYFQDQVVSTNQKITGTPWTVGAAGCVVWTGVPLKSVVEALGGIADGAKFITGTGGETLPDGLDPLSLIVERSVPLDTLDNVILAWDVNGSPISLAHGGPLRMIVPGYSGVNNVKYIRALVFTPKQTEAKIQKTNYRMHPLDRKATSDDPAVWAMNVRSWITTPLTSAKSGALQITGLAFGGINALAKVEVSTDGGTTWKDASLSGPNLGRFAWRQFTFPAKLAAGAYKVVCRATDSEGKVQPKDTEINGGGYLHNGWQGPGIDLSVT